MSLIAAFIILFSGGNTLQNVEEIQMPTMYIVAYTDYTPWEIAIESIKLYQEYVPKDI